MRTARARNTFIFLGLGLAAVTAPAAAQDTQGNVVIGPPQLRDFQLQPRDRPAPQPPAQQQPPAATPPPAEAPASTAPPVTQPAPQQQQSPVPRAGPQPRQAPTPVASRTVAEPEAGPVAPVPVPQTSAPEPLPAPTDVAPEAPAEVAPAASVEETDWLLYAGGAALLALLLGGLFLSHRKRQARRAIVREALEEEKATPARPVVVPALRAAEAEPAAAAPRARIEIELTAKRAAFTAEEATVGFDLIFSNKGEVAARNLKIDVKLINAGAEQDDQIGAFFETAGRATTKLNLPQLPAGTDGHIDGEVGMKREEIRALQLDNRLLFIPVLCVNILYDWGTAEVGQTAKSFVIGRTPPQGADKLAPFRVDLGPRVWRSVEMRPHRLAKVA